jgi:DNA repair protein RecO
MPRSFPCEALVLKTYDVGEADRFCILFTRERGRIAARAAGVRKLMSRKGGALLPFQHVSVELRESGGGFFITSATLAQQSLPRLCTPRSFALAQQGIELLLALVTHEEPLPDVFEATRAFLAGCVDGEADVGLGYQVRLLHLLGFLPEEGGEAWEGISADEGKFLNAAARGNAMRMETEKLAHVRRCVEALTAQHLSSPLKSPAIASLLS